MQVLPTSRGRPRSDKAHLAILKAALALVAEIGFRVLTIDLIAERAGVGKTTIYRRWPNKAAVVMDAFLALVGPGTKFPAGASAVQRIKLQMRLQARFFRSSKGRMIKALLGEAQFDAELAKAFRDRWIKPRREMTRGVLLDAIRQGELRSDIDLDATIDLLYGPIYYRLQIGTGPITEAFTDRVLVDVMRGLGRGSQRRSRPQPVNRR
jgi:AcrR family transcriptional regulator